MEIRQRKAHGRLPVRRVAARPILFFFSSVIFAAGCAAPGQPVTRQPAAPAAITDLSARQIGDGVNLNFSLPAQTAQGRALALSPQIDIYRDFVSSTGTLNNSFIPPQERIVTIPSAMVQKYRMGQHYFFSDKLSPEDIAAHVPGEVVYMVRTRISKHDSGNSNVVVVHLFPPPQPVENLQAAVAKSAINLSWTSAKALAGGMPRAISVRYRVYRSSNVVNTCVSGPSSNRETQGTAGSLPFGMVAETSSPSYSDSNFRFGVTYAYYVVSVARYEGGSVESESSNIIEVTPRNTFPPPAPSGLVAVVATANENAPVIVDLSWLISPENDLAGYNVYRSETDNGPWNRLNTGLLLTPSFRDIRAMSGQLFYRVTAVDRSGNESAPSAVASVSVPAKSDQEKR